MARNDDGLIGLDNILNGLDNYVESQIVGLAQDLRSSLAAATPIEDPPTNNIVAREHWQIAVDSYTVSGSTGEPPFTGGVEVDMRVRRSGRFLAAPGKGAGLAGFDIRKSQNIVIFNDVSYMARLNRGWSPQAAPGFIERVIDEVTARWGMI